MPAYIILSIIGTAWFSGTVNMFRYIAVIQVGR